MYRYCPRCGEEYRPGFTRCAECDVELVAERPEPAERVVRDPSESQEQPVHIVTNLVQVYRVGRVDADIVRSLLEGHGIPAVTDNRGGGLYPVTVGELGGGGVYVREQDSERASALIETALSGDLELEEETDGTDPISLSWFRSPAIVNGLAFLIAMALLIVATR